VSGETVDVPPTVEEDIGLGKGVPCYEAGALLQGGQRVGIVLDGQDYTLRMTRNGRLILTK